MASQIGILKWICQKQISTSSASEEPTQRIVNTIRSADSSPVVNQLDLRGKRYEEALNEVDQYLDAAILAGYPQVTIVHGKETGALRQGLPIIWKTIARWKVLNLRQQIKGNGATIVKFN